MTAPSYTTATLEKIWPLGVRDPKDPTIWHTLAAKHGATAAARMMVIYPRIKELADVDPDSSDHMAWLTKYGYISTVAALRNIVMSDNAPPAALLEEAVTENAMRILIGYDVEQQKGLIRKGANSAIEGYLRNVAKKDDTPASPDIWDLDEFDSARYDNLAKWGWGVDVNVPCEYAFSAVLGGGAKPYWEAVQILRHPNGRCERISEDGKQHPSFDDAMQALTKTVFTGPAARQAADHTPSPAWARPLRTNSTSPNSKGRTPIELSAQFGFASVRFIDTASTAPHKTVLTTRQNLLDALYDGFFDLVDALGMPLNFASMFGNLNLEIGTDVHGLYPHGIHYDQMSYTLRVVVDGAEPLNLSRAFAVALDHVLSFTVQYRADQLELQSSPLGRAVRENGHYLSTYSRHYGSNYADICEEEALQRGFVPVLSAYAQWNEYLGLNRTSDHRPEWVQRCLVEDMGRQYSTESGPSELFGRGFENLIQVVMHERGQANHLMGIPNDAQAYFEPHETFDLCPLGREQTSAAQAFSKVMFALRDFWLNDPVAAAARKA